ncbi:hypothetical protein [Acinetobacter zhairhuonensis]|uniref:hypothetical protein n=1 Tax=Acinetobacter sp. A7.4 TaxID=2919921 RepID=UPI001F4FC427|nr:hypothetical protein [Acinetobacter sp. A7.4]MCJ8162998.1 hypothetical protein [Acinetobacter sp. A7.4]
MHLVEKQPPFEKELTQQIKEAERELLMLDKEDRVLSQLSLTIQLYLILDSIVGTTIPPYLSHIEIYVWNAQVNLEKTSNQLSNIKQM